MKDPRIRIAACRVNTGMNQNEFAKVMGVCKSTVINWENGRTEPTMTQLRKISEVSGIPMDFIFVPLKS